MKRNLIRDISLVLNFVAIIAVIIGCLAFQSEINKLESENESLHHAINLLEVELLDEQGKPMTVHDAVSMPGTYYYIVKDANSLAILEPDVYMDRPVTEIGICDDTPNTLCLFIELDENEEPHIKQQ